MASSLPVLPSAVGHRGPRADVVNLFRAYEEWLNRIRPRLGKNAQVMARSPVATMEGIRFEILNMAEGTVEFLLTLQGYCPGCRIKSAYDDEADKNVYHVTVPWPADHQDMYDTRNADGTGAGGQSRRGWRALFPWGWIDEPKVLLVGIIGFVASASYTTHWGQWKSLAATLGVLPA